MTETLPGPSRFEAFRPLVAEALRRGLMPTINQMRCVNAGASRTSAHVLFMGFPGQYNWQHRDSGHDYARRPRWLKHSSGRVAADDHCVHDLLVERPLLYRCHAPRAESMCRSGTSHPW
jgi:hypothetical protein